MATTLLHSPAWAALSPTIRGSFTATDLPGPCLPGMGFLCHLASDLSPNHTYATLRAVPEHHPHGHARCRAPQQWQPSRNGAVPAGPCTPILGDAQHGRPFRHSQPLPAPSLQKTLGGGLLLVWQGRRAVPRIKTSFAGCPAPCIHASLRTRPARRGRHRPSLDPSRAR